MRGAGLGRPRRAGLPLAGGNGGPARHERTPRRVSARRATSRRYASQLREVKNVRCATVGDCECRDLPCHPRARRAIGHRRAGPPAGPAGQQRPDSGGRRGPRCAGILRDAENHRSMNHFHFDAFFSN